MGFFDRFRRDNTGRDSSRVGVLAEASRPLQQPEPAPAHRPAHPSPALQLIEPRFVVVDVETTGLRADSHRILELALVTTDPWGRVLDEWSTRINPQGPVGATHIHGITAADVARAPLFADVVTDLNARLAGAAVCAHNARFDLAFLRAEYARAGWQLPFVPALCTLEASTHHLPMLDRRRLSDCCTAVGARLSGAHSALGDARATAALLAAFMHPHIGLPPRPADLELPRTAESVAWPTGPSATPQPVGRSRRPAPPQRIRAQLAEAAAAEPSPSLVELVKRFSLVDALDEGAPAGTLAYLEKLAEVIEDGVVTTDEAADLGAVAQAHDLTDGDVTAANRAFVLALAHEALTDGKVTRAERAELKTVAELLTVDPRLLPGLLDRAETARHARLSANLGPLPDPWPHGAPLRVGDKVVFTGCDDQMRDSLEKRSEALGVRVLGSVSAKTAMLVSDGTMAGTKLAKAHELGTRVVHPDTYEVLLRHLQPAQPRSDTVSSVTPPQAAEPDAPLTDLATAVESGANPAVARGNPAEIRRWARENGWIVSDRGRLSAPLLEAYTAAHRDDLPSRT